MPEKYHNKSKKLNFFENGFNIDSNQLLWISLLSLILIAILCLGLWGCKIYLLRNIEDSVMEIEKLQNQRNFELEANFKNLKMKTDDLKKISEAHVYPSKIFDILEELTISQIKFVGFDANLLEAKFNLEVESLDYATLAKQIVVFEDDSRIKKVDLSEVKLNEAGKINSNLKIETDSNFLYTK